MSFPWRRLGLAGVGGRGEVGEFGGAAAMGELPTLALQASYARVMLRTGVRVNNLSVGLGSLNVFTTATASILIWTATSTVTVAEPLLLSRSAACSMAHESKKHIGEVVRFSGIFKTDHKERAIVTPLGCDRGIGFGSAVPGILKLLIAADPPPYGPVRGITGVFEALILQDTPDDDEFLQDDGIRLKVQRAWHLEASKRSK